MSNQNQQEKVKTVRESLQQDYKDISSIYQNLLSMETDKAIRLSSQISSLEETAMRLEKENESLKEELELAKQEVEDYKNLTNSLQKG